MNIYSKISFFAWCRMALALAVVLLNLETQAQSGKIAEIKHTLQLWDDQPAKEWMSDAYPIGNGRIGGMVFGGVSSERIQFNDNTLWTGNETDRGAYQAFGDLFIDFDQQGDFSDYKRELDISQSLHRVNYRLNGINYSREYFCSLPDQVMVLRFKANVRAGYSGVIRLKDAHETLATVSRNQIQFAGRLGNGMQYQATAMLELKNGKSSIEKDPKGGMQLRISNADEVTIVLTAATDFKNDRNAKWRGEAPAPKIDRILAAAKAKSYPVLLNRHLKDYQQLFGRVSLNLGSSAAAKMKMKTLDRLLDYKNGGDSDLESLLFQYGRYLLISSSRKGGLPANLQGLWNDTNNPPWGGDYHTNINIQMNYWPAEVTNLSECHFPYLDHINAIREIRKINTQKEYPGVRGWTLRTESNPFGGESYLWNTPGSAWYAQALWEHYAFTKDLVYLKNFAYPILKEISEFWDDHLKRRPDGTVVAPMGWSPEHGPTEDGVTHDQQIIYDLFTNYIESADALKIDKAYRDHIADLKANLLKPKIGKWGQLQEWETDRDDPKDQHRHVSHLFGLHPGREISTIKTPELARAAKVSLLARGDASTGWSMAWKINFWARLQDGDHAHQIIKNFINPVGVAGIDYNNGGGIYANLFCAHPPFQIDGNFGYTAGISEMLVQSHADEIQILAALPKAWPSGQVKGLRTRGNFEILNLEWKNGEITNLEIKSLSGDGFTLRVPNQLSCVQKKVEWQYVEGGFRWSHQTQAGKVYQFTKS